MIEKYITYAENGRLLMFAQALTETLPINSMEVDNFEASFLDTHYLDLADNTIKERPNQNTILNKLTLNADGVDAITITNFPNGLFTASNAKTGETVSGNISDTDTFSTTILGTYKIKIESFPYLDFKATIEAI